MDIHSCYENGLLVLEFARFRWAASKRFVNAKQSLKIVYPTLYPPRHLRWRDFPWAHTMQRYEFLFYITPCFTIFKTRLFHLNLLLDSPIRLFYRRHAKKRMGIFWYSLFSIRKGCRKKRSDKAKGMAELMRHVSTGITKLLRFLSQKQENSTQVRFKKGL